MFDVEVDAEQVEAMLQALQTPGFLAETFEGIGAQLNTDLAKYPPQRPPRGDTPPYRRTNTLGRGWTHKQVMSLFSIRTIIGNVTPYARYVQGADDQAEIHQGWWQTTDEVLAQREQWIIEQVLDGIQQHVASYQ